jgi:hypothetical protein
MTCMPTGSLSASKPTGRDSAGNPARLGTPVNCMLADSMSSRWPFAITTSVALHGVAVKGSVGVTKTSTRLKPSTNSFRSTLR